VTSCLSDPGSFHDDSYALGHRHAQSPWASKTHDFAAASGAEHPESAMRPLSFELMGVETASSSGSIVKRWCTKKSGTVCY
jgi:hypothetical protein